MSEQQQGSGISILFAGKSFDITDDTGLQLAVAVDAARKVARIDEAELSERFEALLTGVTIIAIKFGAAVHLAKHFAQPLDQEVAASFEAALATIAGIRPMEQFAPAANAEQEGG